MYAREVKGQTLTFLVSGKLWGDSLVMGDVQTRSEWSHLLGTAMHGPLKGTKLESIPSVIATWERWKQDHPETTVSVFPRSAGAFRDAVLAEDDLRDFVVGLRHLQQIVAYPLPRLAREKVINDMVGGDAVVVVYDPVGHATKIFRRQLEGQVLEFSREGEGLMAGGSRWDRTTGEAVDGPWKGKRLESMPAILSYARTWKMFHPRGRVYGE